MEAKHDVHSIPLFPPMCVMPPEEKECSAFGITLPCAATPNNHDIFGQEIVIGHWLNTFSLVGIGFLNLSYTSFPFQRTDTMKIITGFYSVFTGFFTLLRLYFGVSRFLLMAAAVHNFAEWAMLMMVAAVNTTESQIERSIRYFMIYIYSIIILVVMMPTLSGAMLVEQATGITIDFTLAFVFTYMYRKSGDPEVRKFYRYPAIAHTVHLFFTILPLVFSILHAGNTSWYNSFYLETAVFISAPITHFFYMAWSINVDELRAESAEKDKTRIIPAKYRVHNIKKFVAVSFFCGFFAVVGIPTLMGSCATSHSCLPSQEIVGTSEAVVQPGFELAFEDFIQSQQLVSKAQAFKGNKGYTFVKDVLHAHKYRFIERWESKDHLDAWLAAVGVPTFDQPSVKNLLVGGKLQGVTGYMNFLPSSCRNVTNGGIAVDVRSSCERVWSVISNWSDCSWVIGCRYAVVDPETNNRALYMEDGNTLKMSLRKLDTRDHELVFEILNSAFGSWSNNVGVVKAAKIDVQDDSSTRCRVLYNFIIPKTMRADVVYEDFLKNRVPALQKLFDN